jgi:uncharacterized repeat protein (TIGR03803 family)
MKWWCVNQFAVTCAWRFWLRVPIPAFAVLAILTIGWATPLRAQGQFYYTTTLYTFGTASNDGQSPHNGSLVRDASGDLFGTTQFGGAHNDGTVYELVNSSGSYTERILYSFAGGIGDGAVPIGGVILDSSGNLYATTEQGGAYNHGTVFELVNSSGIYTETILYSFASSPDGATPFAGLTMDSSGNLHTWRCASRVRRSAHSKSSHGQCHRQERRRDHSDESAGCASRGSLAEGIFIPHLKEQADRQLGRS